MGARGASAASTTRVSPTAPTTSSPWSPRRWSCSAAAGADDPAAILRPLLEAALDNALTEGDAALTGPIVRGDVNTVRAHLAEIAATAPDTLAVLRRAGAGHPRPRRDRRPRAPDPGRRASAGVLDEALAGRPPPPRPCSRRTHSFDDLAARSSRPRARSWPRRSRARARPGPPVALVPTMGALHDGPRRAAARGAGSGRVDGPVVASIFVNPLQFGAGGGPRPLPAHPRGRPATCAARGRRRRVRARPSTRSTPAASRW